MSYLVELQPTEDQIAAGIKQLQEDLDGYLDDLDDDQLSDIVTFIWQAMLAAR